MVDSWVSNRQSTKVKLAPRFESPRNNQQPKNEVIEEKMDEDWGNPPPPSDALVGKVRRCFLSSLASGQIITADGTC